MPIYSGDPLTPGIGATKDAKRLDRKDAQTITKIPVLPISYGDAQPLLAALEGPVAPEAWRGALPITYRVGPGPGEGPPEARLRLEARARQRRHREIAGLRVARRVGRSAATTTTPGSTAPRIRSAASSRCSRRRAPRARSSSAAGGRSARSSSAPGTARSRACSARPSGPRRTPPSCREGRRLHQHRRQRPRASWTPAARTPSRAVVNGAAAEVEDPEKKISVLARARLKQIADATKPEDRKAARGPRRPAHRGARLGLRLHAVPPAPRDRVAQPRLRRRGRRRHLPLDLRRLLLVHALRRHRLRLRPGARADRRHDDAAPGQRRRPAARLRAGGRGDRDGTSRRSRSSPTQAPRRLRRRTSRSKRTCPGRSRIRESRSSRRSRSRPSRTSTSRPAAQNASDALTAAAGAYARAFDAALAPGARGPAARAPPGVERRAARLRAKPDRADAGLPGRPWYKHFIYAPGAYTGYGVKTLPAVREALDQKKWDDVNPAAASTAAVIEKAAEQVKLATKLLGGQV